MSKTNLCLLSILHFILLLMEVLSKFKQVVYATSYNMNIFAARVIRVTELDTKKELRGVENIKLSILF